ncbi:MAG: hypothetical protein ACPGD5_11445, partial [Salibacteraceae bacterium]
MKKAILLITVLWFALNGFSGHTGNSITYEAIGNNQYKVSVYLYSDNNSIPINPITKLTVRASCSSTSVLDTFSLYPVPFIGSNNFGGPYSPVTSFIISAAAEEVSDLCDKLLNPNVTPQSSLRGGQVQGYLRNEFSGIITLNPCDYWTLQYWNFSPTILNSNLDTTTYYGSQVTINTDLFPNISAPNFNDHQSPGRVNANLNQKGEYHFGSNNPDNDSLVYELTCALTDSSKCANYITRFSANAPIENAKLNSVTGRFTFLPTTIGKRAVAVLVSKYDNCSGKLKGTFYRRVEIVVNVSNNKNPNYSYGIEKVTGPSAIKLDSFQISTKAGEMFTIEDTLYDPDVNDTLVVFSDHDKYFLGSQLTLNYISKNRVHFKFTHQTAVNEFGTKVLHLILSDDRCNNPSKKRLGYHFKIGSKLNLNNGLSLDTIIVFKGDSVQVNSNGKGKMNWTSLSGSPLIWNGVNQNVSGDTTVSDTNLNILFQPDTSSWLSVTGNVSDDCFGKSPQTDSIYLKVIPTFGINVPIDTMICATVDSFQLNVIPDSNFTYTYKWETIKGSLSNDTVANPWAFSIENSIYLVTVTSQHGGKRYGQLNVVVKESLPKMEILADYDTVCVGSQVEMQLSFLDSTPYCSVGTPAKNNNFKLTHNKISVLSDTVLPGLNTNPFASGKGNIKQQYIYRADSLVKQGIKKGYIQGMSFYIDSTQGSFWIDSNSVVSVSLACTNDTVLNGFQVNGLSEVIANKTWVIHPGWNQLDFDSSYLWDGNSNLLLQFCNSIRVNSKKVRTAMQIVNYNATLSSVGVIVNCNTQFFSWSRRDQIPVTKFDWHAYKDTSNYSY